jgi:hypothetical protein
MRRSDTEKGFAQVCRRLLEVDPTCDKHKGCPAEVVGWPMLAEWWGYADDASPHLKWATTRLIRVERGTRDCEFPEIRHIAQKYLDRVGMKPAE